MSFSNPFDKCDFSRISTCSLNMKKNRNNFKLYYLEQNFTNRLDSALLPNGAYLIQFDFGMFNSAISAVIFAHRFIRPPLPLHLKYLCIHQQKVLQKQFRAAFLNFPQVLSYECLMQMNFI